MSMKYEDLQSLESEKKSQGLPPLPDFLQHFCSGPCPLLLTLVLILLLMIGIIVIVYKCARIQSDVETLRATFSNFTSNTEAQVQSLHFQGGSLQATRTSLKAVVENQEQELQTARSLNDKVFSLEIKLEKEQQELQTVQPSSPAPGPSAGPLHCPHYPLCVPGYSEMLLRVQQLVKNLHTLHCQVAALQSNASQDACCPVTWLEHDGSCYWFSRARSTWSGVEKSCQLQNAHLVVINSREEQNFIAQHSAPFHTWIGLVEGGGSWKWVDGTDYRNSYKNWGAGQPNNWKGNEDDPEEDCAEIREDGRWNNDDCLRVQQWACELKLKVSGQEP